MATTNIFPIYIRIGTRISRKLLGIAARSQRADSMELVGGSIGGGLTCVAQMHAWSWPRANKEERLTGFNARHINAIRIACSTPTYGGPGRSTSDASGRAFRKLKTWSSFLFRPGRFPVGKGLDKACLGRLFALSLSNRAN